MTKAEDFGGSFLGNPSCVFCSYPDGSLKSQEAVREQMIRFWESRENLDRTAAEKATDELMAKMPAWKQ